MRPLTFVVVIAAGLSLGGPALDVQELRSIGGLRAHVAASFDEISACHVSRDGDYLIFDRRAHAVFAVTPGADARRVIVQIGLDAGRLLRPSAFDSLPGDGTFAVADAPASRQRIQFFYYTGAPQGGFFLPGRPVPLITLGDIVLSGIGSLRYTGLSVLISQPQVGALVTEYGLDGRTIRTFGELRPTGQERDRDVHMALNAGLALVNPKGGYYFVFISGIPMFRKYDAAGRFVFERHIEGVELDPYLAALPTTWPRRSSGGDEFPVVAATVRTAAVDPDGNLWISLMVPYTYMYDSRGDKRRTVQFRGAGIFSATGFFFTKDRHILVTPGCYEFRP